MPATNYSADLPLSIGLQSKTATLRLMGDIQINIFSDHLALTAKEPILQLIEISI
jgi:hypothetical protein